MSKKFDPSKFHLLEADYSKPLLEIPIELKKKIINRLTILYDSFKAKKWYPEVERIMKVYYAHKTDTMKEWEKRFNPKDRFTEKDVVLITYGDIIKNRYKKPIKVLSKFVKKYLKNVINTIHLLPFYPYSSDRGFSVIDFEQVDPRIGSWEDIINLKKDFKLMFDGVFNHISSKSRWFQEFLNGNPDYQNYFIVLSTKEMISEDHLKLILRPRTTPLFTEFDTINGKKLVWTTFSPDQIDLNYRNPKVLIRMLDILLYYVRRGADIIRLDAVTYLWEELGTECAHLKQTHETIKLFRDILSFVAPHVAIITETNVPHEQNIKYFGNGYDEAHMVYNFALPPLVLYTYYTKDSTKLTNWAKTITKVSDEATYFNFLDSHDGIGLLPAKGILDDKDIEMMVLKTLEHGGFISYRTDKDGNESPYELNITWYSALNNEDEPEDEMIKLKRFISSRVIALSFMGVPAIYIHSLFASKNDAEAVLNEKQTRSINRKVLSEKSLNEILRNESSHSHKALKMLINVISKRVKEKAFHPNAQQKVINIDKRVFALLREYEDSKVLVIVNITDAEFDLNINLKHYFKNNCDLVNLITEQKISYKDSNLLIKLKPYDYLWLKGY
ncbi:sucrose phosphorylase [Deferribacter desulfuricans SSM1]|uniref:Sucrose phosphorylase n=1 Tax=Deferribacter desulfuricans (strain DSM 14783 / JCM 11476 / NBRC 101012 / SSM1) TaxID=639282 RepID=D3PAG7_DEFDS|nr:alpha-amylase family glycosyl hydrolase [Deferribacter desulfuricans]BAI79590.1 sucrose phosphorylase [Deferribacter desulfuricans SSM1]